MNIHIYSSPTHYRSLAESANQIYIPVFAQPYWLDAVAEQWDVLLAEKEGQIIAALPYCLKGKLITRRIYLPVLSFYQSIHFTTGIGPDEQQQIALALFQELPGTLKAYFKFLPEYSFIDLSVLHYQRSDYTSYFLHPHEQSFSLTAHHERHIRKAEKGNYTLKECIQIEDAYTLLASTFTRRRVRSPLSLDEFSKLIKTCRKHECGKLLECRNPEGRLLASAFIAEDTGTVYYLMGGYNAEFRNSGAMTFLLKNLITSTLQKGKSFNFCGSSQASIAHFFEGFGANKHTIPIWTKNFLA